METGSLEYLRQPVSTTNKYQIKLGCKTEGTKCADTLGSQLLTVSKSMFLDGMIPECPQMRLRGLVKAVHSLAQ